MTLSVEALRKMLDYNPDTGVFTWLVSPARNVKVGQVAGCRDGKYRVIGIDGESHFEHRLAWFHTHGVWPILVDHVDGNGLSNKLVNLREASVAQNGQNRRKAQRNNRSGYLGVTVVRGRAKATIWSKGVCHNLGYFDTPELAHAGYLAAKRSLHEFGTL